MWRLAAAAGRSCAAARAAAGHAAARQPFSAWQCPCESTALQGLSVVWPRRGAEQKRFAAGGPPGKPRNGDAASGEGGVAGGGGAEDLPPFTGDPSELPLERDPSVSAYSTGSADILGGGPSVNRVSSFSPTGFVVNDQRIEGAVALLPKLKLRWSVRSVKDVTPASLSLFAHVSPPIELLVVGAGDRMEPLPREAMQFLKDQGIAVELQATRRACATYNFLSAEGRLVAAALIPPTVGPGK